MTKYLSVGILFFSVSIFFFGPENEEVATEMDKELISLKNLNEIPPIPARDTYGFIDGEYEILEETIKRNENLYILLNRHGISSQTIYEIQQKAEDGMNLHRMLPGQKYRMYKDDDGLFSFVWHQTPTRFVTIILDDEITLSLDEIPVITKINKVSGIIANSLYETVLNEGGSQFLGAELAEIFAWEIDFFSLRRGDHFKVIHEELYANDVYVGLGDIKAAEFQHRGTTHRAYYFDNGSRRGYFDKDGNSMQKALLKAPFQYNQRISSGFSQSRFHPILRERRPHHGTDYAAPTGTPILAVGDGVVTEAQRRGGNGNIVQIRHNGTYKTAYLHLNGFASGVRKGATVKQGQIIGYVGSTGLATGPHLCYRLYVNERPVNSLTVDMPASESLDEEYMDQFLNIAEQLDEQLESLSLSESLAFN
ncbi:MAG: peptidoglycan DD-metalloendopeptidase family protein [Balneolaceae bacterium]